MLHFRMDMPLYLMAFYGSIMILAVLLIRVLFKRRLPQFVFPVLWGLVLVRLFDPIFPVQPDQCACFGAADAIHRKRSDCSGRTAWGPERMFPNATEYSVAEGNRIVFFQLAAASCGSLLGGYGGDGGSVDLSEKKLFPKAEEQSAGGAQ